LPYGFKHNRAARAVNGGYGKKGRAGKHGLVCCLSQVTHGSLIF
jgi:hypothetical protein